MMVLALMRYVGEENGSELVALTTSQEVAVHWIARDYGNIVEEVELNDDGWPRQGKWNKKMTALMRDAERARTGGLGHK